MDDWDEFSARFLRTVMQLGERSFLVLENPENRHFTVQLRVDEESLHAHCSIMILDLDDPAVTTRLTELGWSDKGEDAEKGYFWGRNLQLPAMSSAYQRLVADSVATMRELQGISSPSQLRYKAWREPEGIPDGVLYYEEDLAELDPGENPLHLDLGIALQPQS